MPRRASVAAQVPPRLLSSVVEHSPCKRKVVGSIPTGGSRETGFQPAGATNWRSMSSRTKPRPRRPSGTSNLRIVVATAPRNHLAAHWQVFSCRRHIEPRRVLVDRPRARWVPGGTIGGGNCFFELILSPARQYIATTEVATGPHTRAVCTPGEIDARHLGARSDDQRRTGGAGV